MWYYYWQGSILLFLIITYLRVLHSGALLVKPQAKGQAATGSADYIELKGVGNQISLTTDSTQPSIVFNNNKIKIRTQDPCRRRDLLILKSWTGALLGLCSIMSAFFSLIKLMPAIYRSSCHQRHTWTMSQYPGATFALLESLASLACLGLLFIAVFLNFILAEVPKFFLRSVPRAYKSCRIGCSRCWNKDKQWKPNTYMIDYGIELMGNNHCNFEYDCSQLTDNFGARNISIIQRPGDQSALFLNDMKLISASPETSNALTLSQLTKIV